MSDLSEALKPYVGMESHTDTACDVVERGAVRRYAQAIMNEDPIFSVDCENNQRYGGPVAPPFFRHTSFADLLARQILYRIMRMILILMELSPRRFPACLSSLHSKVTHYLTVVLSLSSIVIRCTERRSV